VRQCCSVSENRQDRISPGYKSSEWTRVGIKAYASLGGLIAENHWRGGRWLRRHVIESLDVEFAVVRFSYDALFRFHLKDFYWNRLLLRGYEYEQPLASLLQRLAGENYAFVDCGANLGYWSILVSSKAYGSKPAVAIEALQSNAELLARNCELNGNRFECWHKAIYSRAGEAIELFGDADTHFGASIRAEWHNSPSQGMVITTTVDEAARHLARQDVVVKLDVEGVEIDAFEGARETLAAGALLIYEDHPRDTEHKPTAYLLKAGYEVRLITAKGSFPIRDADMLTQEKRRENYEYNLAAFSPACRFRSLLD
jgi:FkbM family methyltransferase